MTYSLGVNFENVSWSINLLPSIFRIFLIPTFPRSITSVEQMVTAGNGIVSIDVALPSKVTVTGWSLQFVQMDEIEMVHNITDETNAITHHTLERETQINRSLSKFKWNSSHFTFQPNDVSVPWNIEFRATLNLHKIHLPYQVQFAGWTNFSKLLRNFQKKSNNLPELRPLILLGHLCLRPTLFALSRKKQSWTKNTNLTMD